jgi:tetratricopeptide (TPR) repeat protein
MKASHNPNADNSQAKAQATLAMEARDWTEALRLWKLWWSSHPQEATKDPDAMHDRAVSHFHCEEPGKALEWLDLAAALQPEYSYRYASRGWMKQAIGDTPGAIADYQRAVQLDPEDAVTWNNLGLLEEQMGYQAQAKERYKISDELMGILEERGIDTENAPSTTAPLDAPSLDPTRPDEERTFWGECSRVLRTAEGRSELWAFIKNGFTLRG